MQRIRRVIEAHPETTFEEIGVSLPGRVDRFTQRLVFAPNFGWRAMDLKNPLERATGLPVSVENAANACALSEVWSGPFAGVQDLVAVTISEGIGTCIIANGHLVRGPSGAAGEFGHVCLDPKGPPCRCGSRGCWEVYASNAAAVRAYNRGMQGGRISAPPKEAPNLCLGARFPGSPVARGSGRRHGGRGLGPHGPVLGAGPRPWPANSPT